MNALDCTGSGSSGWVAGRRWTAPPDGVYRSNADGDSATADGERRTAVNLGPLHFASLLLFAFAVLPLLLIFAHYTHLLRVYPRERFVLLLVYVLLECSSLSFPMCILVYHLVCFTVVSHLVAS